MVRLRTRYLQAASGDDLIGESVTSHCERKLCHGQRPTEVDFRLRHASDL